MEGGGKKTFVWKVGDERGYTTYWNTTVNYYNANRVAGDGMAILKFGPGVTPENVEVRNSGSNVVFVITLSSGVGNMTFVNANMGDVRYQVDEIQFADGTVWQWNTMPRQ